MEDLLDDVGLDAALAARRSESLPTDTAVPA
jgi:hypothetical protein